MGWKNRERERFIWDGGLERTRMREGGRERGTDGGKTVSESKRRFFFNKIFASPFLTMLMVPMTRSLLLLNVSAIPKLVDVHNSRSL